MVFPSCHLWMCELYYKENWMPKNWCFWTVVMEKTLESPLDWKEIKPVNPKENQPWIFIGRTNAEAQVPILWPSDAKVVNSLEKTLVVGKIEGRRRREQQRMRWLDGIIDSMHLTVSEVWEMMKDREALHPLGHKELDMTEWLNNNKALNQTGLQVTSSPRRLQ